jgi:general stress protein 26
MESTRKKVLQVMRRNKLAVISTVKPERTPEAALIAFAEDEQLRIYFQTGARTRKAANLKTNPAVALVIGISPEEWLTVQYEGTARQVTGADELKAVKQRFIDKDSPTKGEYLTDPSAIFFQVTPTWIGCSDYTGSRPEVTELMEFD